MAAPRSQNLGTHMVPEPYRILGEQVNPLAFCWRAPDAGRFPEHVASCRKLGRWGAEKRALVWLAAPQRLTRSAPPTYRLGFVAQIERG